jgi:ethanolamine utilization protein EutP (predicted NTPase)
MLRFALVLGLGVAAVTLSGTTFTAKAEDKKVEAKKFEGTLTCTKCALSETKACGHALIVKEGDKDVKYYLVDKGGKEAYHKECCTGDVKATVTGKPGEKDGKKIIEEPKVEVKK